MSSTQSALISIKESKNQRSNSATRVGIWKLIYGLHPEKSRLSARPINEAVDADSSRSPLHQAFTRIVKISGYIAERKKSITPQGHLRRREVGYFGIRAFQRDVHHLALCQERCRCHPIANLGTRNLRKLETERRKHSARSVY